MYHSPKYSWYKFFLWKEYHLHVLCPLCLISTSSLHKLMSFAEEKTEHDEIHYFNDTTSLASILLNRREKGRDYKHMVPIAYMCPARASGWLLALCESVLYCRISNTHPYISKSCLLQNRLIQTRSLPYLSF